MASGLRSILVSFSQPKPRKIITPIATDYAESNVLLASGSTPELAMRNLLNLMQPVESRSILVVPSVAIRPGQRAHPKLVGSLLAHFDSAATLGIPFGTPQPLVRRWNKLARNSGSDATVLGSKGWDRLDLTGQEHLLDRVYLPAELQDAEQRIFMPALRDESLALGFLRSIAHPHTRLRTRSNAHRTRLDAEVARTAQGSFVLDATRLPGLVATNLVAWADDPLTTELVAVGIRRFLDTERGLESISAWEHERVQVATELGIGPPSGEGITLVVQDTDIAVLPLKDFLANELNCTACVRQSINQEGG